MSCGLRLALVADDSCFGVLRLGRPTQSFDLTDGMLTAIRTIQVVCARAAIRFHWQHFDQLLTRRFDAPVLPLTSMFDDELTPNQPDRGQPRPALGFTQPVMTISSFIRLADRHLTGRGASSGGR